MRFTMAAGAGEKRASRVLDRETPCFSVGRRLGQSGVAGASNRLINFYSVTLNPARAKKLRAAIFYFFSAPRRQAFNSALSSLISMPAMTMNLQESISRGLLSSGSLQTTRQY